jgi:hypothetical protein
MSLGALVGWLAVLGAGVYALVGLPRVPTSLPAAPADLDVQLQLLVRSPTGPQLDAVIYIVQWLFWLGWVYVTATTLLRVGVVLGERVAARTTWMRSLRWLSDWLTLPFVRRAVDASLAGAMLVRVAVMTPSPPVAMAAPLTAQVDPSHAPASEHGTATSISAAEVDNHVPPDDVRPGEIVHVVRPAILCPTWPSTTWATPMAGNRSTPTTAIVRSPTAAHSRRRARSSPAGSWSSTTPCACSSSTPMGRPGTPYAMASRCGASPRHCLAMVSAGRSSSLPTRATDSATGTSSLIRT